MKNSNTVDCNCEFGYELQLVIPYTYYLYENNLLLKTISCKKTRELYYFSKNHEEKYNKRICCQPDVPNKSPHIKELNYDMYVPPPYQNIFKNTLFLFNKPLLIIHNKYNIEWGGPPVNYIDKNSLEKIFEHCYNRYTVVYIRPNFNEIISDNSEICDLDEYDILNKYSILNGNKLYQENKLKNNINNFNHFQLLIHSNCSHFISVQGGNSVLASYFGGTNIIYACKGGEINSKSYHGHYKKYSDCKILHSNNYTDFIKLIKSNY